MLSYTSWHEELQDGLDKLYTLRLDEDLGVERRSELRTCYIGTSFASCCLESWFETLMGKRFEATRVFLSKEGILSTTSLLRPQHGLTKNAKPGAVVSE